MSQLGGMKQNGGTSNTIEQLLKAENPTSWNTSSVTGKFHDHENDHLHHGKKFSVIAKVKEKAKKWRQNLLVKKKHGHHDSYHTPSWGVALEDYELEDEHDNNLGSLGNESQDALKNLNQVKPRPSTSKVSTTGPNLGKSISDNRAGNNNNPSYTGSNINESPRAKSLGNHLREKQESPAEFTIEALIAQRNQNIEREKEEHRTIENAKTIVDRIISSEENNEDRSTPKNKEDDENEGWKTPDDKEQDHQQATITCGVSETVTFDKDGSKTLRSLNPKNEGWKTPGDEDQDHQQATITYDVSEAVTDDKDGSKTSRSSNPNHKGFSVKEYLKQKFEPGEDEKALAQVITEVITPRRSAEERSVMQRVRTAVSMLLQFDEEQEYSPLNVTRSDSEIPLSTNAQEVEEEKQG